MAGAIAASALGEPVRRGAVGEPAWVRRGLIGFALVFLAVFLALPLVVVFYGAFSGGASRYFAAISTPESLSAIRLTVITAAIAVPLNVAFGVCAAWLIARFRFRLKGLLITLIDVPFSVSPVIAGLSFVLLFGRQGAVGSWLLERGVSILFAPAGIVLATIFVTFPFVAREVMTQLEAQGADAEEAALTLGANGWQMFFRITLPRVKWSLLYGVVLCNARAMGEFGAVSVVSGHIRGVTNTMPLHVEILYNEYDSTGAFAVSSLLTLIAVVTLVVKKVAVR